MKRYAWIAGLLITACIGCNAGMAPAPMNESELKTAVEKMPPKDQIAYINSSPMSPAKKAERIKEIEEKTGYKPEAVPGPPDAAK